MSKLKVVILLFLFLFLFFIGVFYTPMAFIYFIVIFFLFLIFNVKNKSIYILFFGLSFMLGMIQSYCNYSDALSTTISFNYPDQLESFYPKAKMLASLGIVESFKICFLDDSYLGFGLAHFIFGLIANLELFLFGENTFLNLLLFVSLVSSFIPVLLYKLLLYYVDSKTAIKGVLYYTTCTIFTLYLGYLLRDQFISLLFLMGFLLLHKKTTFFRALLLFAIIIVISQIRLAHALFFLFFVLAKIIMVDKSGLHKNIIISFFLGVIVINLSMIVSNYEYVFGLLSRYEEFTQSAVDSSQSLSRNIYSLPKGLKELVILILSQMNYPSWYSFLRVDNIYQFILAFFDFLGRVGWFFVFYVVMTNFKQVIYILKRNKILKVLYLLSFVFLLANTSNMTDRRIMAVFPVLFIPFVITTKNKSKYQKLYLIGGFLCINFLLFVVLLFLKI